MRKMIVYRLGLIEYAQAMQIQQRIFEARRTNATEDSLLILQHLPVISIGTSGKGDHVLVDRGSLEEKGITVCATDRGGDVTFHGPGQIIGYPILNLRNLGIRAIEYVRRIEEVIIRTLQAFNLRGHRIEGAPGVWVNREKICSIGFRVSRGITTHGFALNVNTDLDFFKFIVPCGIKNVSMTSMEKLVNRRVDMEEVSNQVVLDFCQLFDAEALESDTDAEGLVAKSAREWGL
jgi:lipoate-protein ligase B